MTHKTQAVDTVQHLDPADNLGGRELLETARRAVRQLRGARNNPGWTLSTVDDTISDVVEACLHAQDHGTVVTARYVYAVANNLLHRDRDLCSADARALRMLAERTAALEQEQGHEASPAQVDRLAALIIEEWDRPSRRPTRGFHLRKSVVSLDAPAGDTLTLADLLPAPPPPPDDGHAVVEELDRLAEEARSAHNKAEHSAVRRACWDTLAKAHGAPTVTGPVAKNKVTQARSIIVRHPDGPQAAISMAIRHADRGTQSSLTEALFTPFAGVDKHGRRKVLDLLRRHRPHAVDLWAAALSASSRAFYRDR